MAALLGLLQARRTALISAAIAGQIDVRRTGGKDGAREVAKPRRGSDEYTYTGNLRSAKGAGLPQLRAAPWVAVRLRISLEGASHRRADGSPLPG